MAVKLHRCGVLWAKVNMHPCWRVQKALDDAGVEYEIVKESWPSRKGRTAVVEGTGQNGLPAIELEDGTWYREESADMAKAIRGGKFGAAPGS
jgi:glutaredoxin